MKKILYILSIVLVALLSCKKDDVKVQTPVFNNEDIVLGTTTVKITVKYDYPSVLKNVNGVISTNSDMINPQITVAEMMGLEFTLTFTNLNSNTKYYYYYEYSNGMDESLKSDIVDFTTNEYSLPFVTTADIVNITATSAVSGGEVTDDGGLEITARGVCWSTLHNPTISNQHTSDGSGSGAFTSNLTELTQNVKYYVRAYATNSKGTSYGDEKEFTTIAGLATVTTNSITNITAVSAVCGGNVTSDGGYSVTARGVCWSTTQNPTVSDQHTTDGSGTGTFTSSITGLFPNTTYYVRAYATNSNGTSYSSTKTFKTKWEPVGYINGEFSISPTQKVYFSQGNLQYQASTDTWKFADNQWTYIGEDNANISSTYNGWIDLFGWGSGNNPTNASSSNTTFFEWGNNSITNGGNMYNLWRTLSEEEWGYVLNTRITNSNIRYAKAIVNGVKGVILLPDNWIENIYNLSNTNNAEVDFGSNIIDIGTWTNMFEMNGAVFLPSAGWRMGSSILDIGSCGYYWSSTKLSSGYNLAIYLFFKYNTLSFGTQQSVYGKSVRLVHDVE